MERPRNATILPETLRQAQSLRSATSHSATVLHNVQNSPRGSGNAGETLQSFPKLPRLTLRPCCIMCKTHLAGPEKPGKTRQSFPKLPRFTLRPCCIMCKTHLAGLEDARETRHSFPKPFDKLRAFGLPRVTLRPHCIMCKTHLASSENAGKTRRSFPKLPRSTLKPWARLRHRRSEIGNGPGGRGVISP